jgi:hypothetical protein
MKKTLNKATMPFWQMASVAGYISAQIFADITSIKIATIGNLAIDGGTFIYPLTFTLRDMVHKAWGKKVAKQVIYIAGAINLFMALLFQFIIWLPADMSWGMQNEFAMILGPIWRIVFASIFAEMISELIDTEAYQFFVDKISKKHIWGRVLFSNILAIPIDSVVFALIAFWGILPPAVVGGIIISNILVKGAMTLVSMPMIYLTPGDRE